MRDEIAPALAVPRTMRAMSVIARDSPLPLYHQLKQVLLDQIEGGEWRPGDLLPGEQELQDRYGLSRTTVRQALRELELEGRITRHRGRGTFVSAPKVQHSPEARMSLSESLRGRGLQPGWTVLASGLVTPPPEVAARLEVAAPAKVFRLHRLRLASAEPIGVHVAYLAPAFEALVDRDAFAAGGSLEYLHPAPELDGARAERTIEALPCAPEDADHLGLAVGAPVLRIRRLLVSAGGQPIEDLSATYRGDRFQYTLASPASRSAGP